MVAAQDKARSRSPPKRFSKHVLPEVNTWVQVVTTTSSKGRRWGDAVPALVSKVSHVLGDPKPDVRINVLVPNVLALQYKFKAAEFREFKNLGIADVRPYLGHRHDELKSLLLSAFREKAHKNSTSNKGQWAIPVQRDEQESTTLDNAKLLLSPSRRKFVDKDMDTTPENIAKLFKRCAEGSAQGNRPSESLFEAGSESIVAVNKDMDTTPENIAKFFKNSCDGIAKGNQETESMCETGSVATLIAASTSCASSLDDPAAAGLFLSSCDSPPRTPRTSSKKTLGRNITPTDPDLPRPHSGHEEKCSSENAMIEPVLLKTSSSSKRLGFEQLSAEALHTTQAPMSKQRFTELTTLISRAFRAQDTKGQGILSKQAITKAIESTGMGLAMGELDEALARLDAVNKIMLSDDLVVRVD